MVCKVKERRGCLGGTSHVGWPRDAALGRAVLSLPSGCLSECGPWLHTVIGVRAAADRGRASRRLRLAAGAVGAKVVVESRL